MRKGLIAALSAVACLGVAAAPASAKKHSATEYDYVATIDCDHGKPMVVGSGADTASPLVDLKTGRRFLPVEWHLSIGSAGYDEVISPAVPGRRMACSYDDGEATGTVIVVKAGTVNGRS